MSRFDALRHIGLMATEDRSATRDRRRARARGATPGGRVVLTGMLSLVVGVVCAGCAPSSSTQASAGTSPVPRASAPASTPPTPTPTPSQAITVGFDLLLDSGGFQSSQILALHGSAARPIALPYPAVLPVPSPDRKRVLFSSPRGLGIMTSGGHVLTLLKGTTSCFGGGWISEGTVVASCSTEPGWPPPGSTWHVVTFTTDGRAHHVLASTDPGDSPAVSPTTHDVTFGLGGSVYISRPAGGAPRLLVRNTESVFWSHDGRYLAYSASFGDGGRQLVLATSSGVRLRILATLPGWNNDLSAAFSPDDRTVLFTGSADTPHDLWEVGVSGGTPRQLTTTGGFGDPSLG